ncbi:Glycerol kinase [hydrothermal vent metagenome]|uniref:Glycerol kinase n=1 Tax=hydrothermal vent metagenome TaxID=652676 RepID=A0A3B0Z9W2_9ZZZZ
MDYLLAIDQGTHASRALIFDAHGQRIASHLVPVGLDTPQAGHVEQDPGEILDSVREAVEHTVQSLPPAERDNIRACGLTTQRSTVLTWQANGAPLSAAISWQDTRGAPLVAALHAHAADIREQSGLPLSAHYGASKLHWLHQLLVDEPELRYGPLASFLLYHLTGSGHVIDHSNAQRMQLMDVGSLTWSHQLADRFQLPLDGLPECRPVISDYGKLLDYGIPITAVCGDQNAAWHSHRADAQGCALINLGSGAFILAAQPPGDGEPELLSSVSVSDAQGAEWLLEGTVNGAGNALQWLAEQYGIDNLPEQLPEWLTQISSPPLFLNSVGGLGSPWWRQLPTPLFVPDDSTHSNAERAVAVVESILFLLQCNLERMLRHTTIERLRVSGGLSQLDGLCQKLANLSGLPVERCDDPEASARGVAWLAAGRPTDWLVSKDVSRFDPVPDAPMQARYREFTELLQQHLGSSDDN